MTKLKEINPENNLEQQFASEEHSRSGNHPRGFSPDAHQNVKIVNSADLNYFQTLENVDSQQLIPEVNPFEGQQAQRLKHISKDLLAPQIKKTVSIQEESINLHQEQKELTRLRQQKLEEQRAKERRLEDEIRALKKEVESATYMNQRLLAERAPDNQSSNQHWTEGWKQMEKTYLSELRTREKNLNLLEQEEDNLNKELNLLDLELEQIEIQRVSLYDVMMILDQEVNAFYIRKRE